MHDRVCMRRCNSRWMIAASVIVASVFTLSAQTVALTGKVTNQSGKAISGAVVTLRSKNLTATTDATGAYALRLTGIHAAQAEPGAARVSLYNGTIAVHASQGTPVTVEVFDVAGNLRKKLCGQEGNATTHRFDLGAGPGAANVMMVRVTVGKKAATFRCFSESNGSPSAMVTALNGSSGVLLAAIRDTLQASATRYTTKKVAISSYEGTVDIVLDTLICQATPSQRVNMTVSGNGPHKVVVETNSDPGIREGTIYRPEDLGPGKKYPIYIWGNGACSLDGKSNSAALAQIASHGYFVISDGTPGGSGSRPMDMAQLTRPARAYVTWAIAQNGNPCSAYYQSLDTTKVAGNGFSCGGLFAMALAGDPRITTWGISSSGSFGNNPELWNSVHTPVLIEEGHKDETGAYNNGLRDFNGIAPLKWPIMFFSNKNFGHGGDLWSQYGGEFTKINLAWLNWWLKGDTTATGKKVLVGPGCKYCTDSNWEVKSANIP